MLSALRLIHLLAAAIWFGGLVALGASVMALRRVGAPREHLQAIARQFARVSWTAMLVAVVTGLGQVQLLGLSVGYRPLQVKVALVVTVIALAGIHTVTARRSSPAVRGMLQAVILLVSLAIYAAAVAL